MTKTLIAALLLAAGLAAAQTETPSNGAAPNPAPSAQSSDGKNLNQEIRADRKEIRADKSAIRQDNAAQRAQISDLNAQEKSAMDAVTADTTLSKPAANAAKRKIHADFKTKKDAIRAQMKVERKAKRADIATERDDIRKDRQERREGAKKP
jgi:hypothetical protein